MTKLKLAQTIFHGFEFETHIMHYADLLSCPDFNIHLSDNLTACPLKSSELLESIPRVIEREAGYTLDTS